jgi:hypothetical protein
MLYLMFGVRGHEETAGGQLTVMPQLRVSALLAAAAPAKLGLKLHAPVAVASTQSLTNVD